MGTAIVTGCSRETGFGQLTAKALAQNGFETFATMRKSERGAPLLDWGKQENQNINVLEHDVTHPEDNRAIVEQVVDKTGRIDVLVNNVGMSSFGALETLHDSHIRDTMETNFFSAVDMVRAVLPTMRKQQGGRIIFVTSIAGVIGVPGESIYSASKFALEGLAEVLAMEVARFGIHVSTIRPAFFNTGMSAENTDASQFFKADPAFDDFNRRVIESTASGENEGEDPALVAATILEAATCPEPKLRWEPGNVAPLILEARRTMSDKDWANNVMSELGMADWLEPLS